MAGTETNKEYLRRCDELAAEPDMDTKFRGYIELAIERVASSNASVLTTVLEQTQKLLVEQERYGVFIHELAQDIMRDRESLDRLHDEIKALRALIEQYATKLAGIDAAGSAWAQQRYEQLAQRITALEGRLARIEQTGGRW